MAAAKLTPCPDCAAPHRGNHCRNCGWTAHTDKAPTAARGYGTAHQQLRRQLIRQTLDAGGWTTCRICNRPLNVRLPGTHPAGPQLHHLASTGAGTDPATSALVHGRCNARTGDPTVNPRSELTP